MAIELTNREGKVLSTETVVPAQWLPVMLRYLISKSEAIQTTAILLFKQRTGYTGVINANLSW